MKRKRPVTGYYRWKDDTGVMRATKIQEPAVRPPLKVRKAIEAAMKIAAVAREREDISRVTRLEIIDHVNDPGGRVYVWDHRCMPPMTAELSFQDQGRTLKVILRPRRR